jgi:SulP family sulfate permease
MVFLETVSVARNVRRPSEPPIDNDRELTASGVSCVAGALFRAMPAAGGFSQTAINQSAGAQTQLSELVTAGLAVACALLLGPVLSDLPQATLGAMVMVAVVGLISPGELVRFWQLSRTEFWLVVATAGAGLVFGLLLAVLIGVFATLFIVLRELDRVGVTELQPTGDGDLRVAGTHTVPVPGLLALRFDGPLYTANVRSANRKTLCAVDAAHDVDVLVLDTSAQGMLPVTVIDEMGNLEHELAERGVTLWIAALPPKALATARLLPRWRELETAGHLFPTTLAAVKSYRDR